jgi:hypothetical protein
VVLILFATIGIGAIIVGSIFNNESLFFRIALILLGSIILILFSESFISLLTNRIELTSSEIKLRRYFKWNIVAWADITTFEIEKRTPQFSRSSLPRYLSLHIKSIYQKDIIFPLQRFRSHEALTIIDTIKDKYENITKKVLADVHPPIEVDDKPITEEEISKQIPPKVEEFELEDNEE